MVYFSLIGLLMGAVSASANSIHQELFEKSTNGLANCFLLLGENMPQEFDNETLGCGEKGPDLFSFKQKAPAFKANMNEVARLHPFDVLTGQFLFETYGKQCVSLVRIEVDSDSILITNFKIQCHSINEMSDRAFKIAKTIGQNAISIHDPIGNTPDTRQECTKRVRVNQVQFTQARLASFGQLQFNIPIGDASTPGSCGDRKWSVDVFFNSGAEVIGTVVNNL